MSLRAGLLALASCVALVRVEAQSPAVTRAAATITEADVRRRINVIAHDSMLGRDTPSDGLTKTANYVAGEFRKFGLKPGGDNGGWLQNYPINTVRLLPDRSVVAVASGDGNRGFRVTFADGAAWSSRSLAVGNLRGAITVVGGPGRLDSLPTAGLAGQILLFVTDWTRPGASTRLQQLVRRAQAAGARGVFFLVNSDSVFSSRYSPTNSGSFVTLGTPELGFFSVALRESAILAQMPEAADQFKSIRELSTLTVRPAPTWQTEVTIRDTVLTSATAPNTVGILEGSDPALKNEFIVFSAHMDHIGFRRTPASMSDSARALTDTISNGADDDASGTASVIELAEAFSRPGVRPKRSIIFLTVSGEEKGLWGSEWFVNHPPVSIKQIVADFNSDMLGRNWKDTIVAIGKEHSDLGSTLNRVNAAHPELSMHAIDDRWPEQRFYTRSDHYNFARKGVPILFFFNGTHADYHRVSDSPDKIDAEKESRIVKLFFLVGLDVANAARRPQWVPASYQQIVTP